MISCLLLVVSFLKILVLFFGYLFLFRFNEYLMVILGVLRNKGVICLILEGFNVFLFL